MTGVLRVDRVGPARRGRESHAHPPRGAQRVQRRADRRAARRRSSHSPPSRRTGCGPWSLPARGRPSRAGADIAWQRAAAALSMQENEADVARLQTMLAAIDECPVPVVVRAHGPVLGGGMGLCSVADIVLAEAGATFGFTETKLGILPAVISPFVLRADRRGQRACPLPDRRAVRRRAGTGNRPGARGPGRRRRPRRSAWRRWSRRSCPPGRPRSAGRRR